MLLLGMGANAAARRFPFEWARLDIGDPPCILRAMPNENEPDLMPASTQPDWSSVEILSGALRSGLVLICDHASSAMPEEYAHLGLQPSELERHIAFDIGVDGVTRGLAARLDAPAVLSRFSRLLIDPNRGLDDPTLVMRLSDGAIVPGNAHVDDSERSRRIRRFYEPYHAALDGVIEATLARGIRPMLVSIHSFTPLWKGVPRPWQAGILWKPGEEEIARRLITRLEREPGLVVGDNQPYSGGLTGDTLYRHATLRSLPATLIEVRQDLIATTSGIEEWVERLADPIAELVEEFADKADSMAAQ